MLLCEAEQLLIKEHLPPERRRVAAPVPFFATEAGRDCVTTPGPSEINRTSWT